MWDCPEVSGFGEKKVEVKRKVRELPENSSKR
jgi:hypothetical protein